MEMFAQKPHSPWYSLFILVGLSLICSLVFQLLSLLGLQVFLGDTVDFLNISSLMSNPGAAYVLLSVGSIGTFLLPAVFLQAIERHYFQYFPVASRRKVIFYLLSLVFLLAVNPLLSLVSEWNKAMSLPESMYGIEIWMREKEDQMALLVENLVMTASVGQFATNILVFALVPAICEEFFFRGSVQGIAKRLLKNDHTAIWVTAIVFSAIHFQFYGFLPRVLLGAMFGYMLVWTQNIWVPVFAHFVNNASVTVVAFIFASQGKTYKEMMDAGDAYPVSLYVFSLIGSVAIGYYFYRNRLTKYKREEWKTVG